MGVASPPPDTNDGDDVGLLPSSSSHNLYLSTNNGGGARPLPSLVVHNPYRSVGLFFGPDTSDHRAPLTPNPASPNKRRRLFRIGSPFTSKFPSNNELVPIIPPPAKNELVAVFPPYAYDDYGDYVGPPSVNLGNALLDIAGNTPLTSTATHMHNSTSTASPTLTLFSTCIYAACCNVFQSLFWSRFNKSSFLPSLPFLQLDLLGRFRSLPSIAWYLCAP